MKVNESAWWEPVSWRHEDGSVRDFWGVFLADDYSPEPLAILGSESEASEWLAAFREREHLAGDFAIMLLREGEDGRLWAWNNCADDAPEGLARESPS